MYIWVISYWDFMGYVQSFYFSMGDFFPYSVGYPVLLPGFSWGLASGKRLQNYMERSTIL